MDVKTKVRIVFAASILTLLPVGAAQAGGFHTYVRETVYCGGCDSSKSTASGRAWQGRGIAVDPDIIPLGSKVWISGRGHRPFIADDTGGKVNGHHIDRRRHTDRCTCHRIGVRKKVRIFVVPPRRR